MNNAQFKLMIQKIEKLKASGGFDLSLEEDLSIAIMNLVSLEEHFFFTAKKTEKSEYLTFMQEVRQIRKNLLEKMIPSHQGETWCISKHLLAASMRLIEVGTKYQSAGKQKEAEESFNQAYHVYGMFWGIRLKLIDLTGVNKIKDDQINKDDQGSGDKPWTVEDIVNKLVNCCVE